MGKYPSPPGDSVDPFVQEFRQHRRQLRENARPSGTNIAELVQKVRDALVNINATVISAVGAYLSTGTVAMGAINAAGSITAGGAVGAAGQLSGSSVATPGRVQSLELYGSNAPLPANNITTGRVTAWLRNSDGLVGNTASSRRFKTNIIEAELDPLAILSIDVFYHNYIAEVRKRDDPDYFEYVGPDYHVAQELALMAEDLHEAGLWEFVIYEREPDGTLILNELGEAIPRSIHYELWAMAVHAVTRYLHQRIVKNSERLAAVEERLDAAGL